ncbi:MAG: hypothetical protein PF904_03300 [Kiritimatiellae bacterium]|jgi:hypothetical protein|nr:hypothetical protein [Kiritimatiellia bacterium]
MTYLKLFICVLVSSVSVATQALSAQDQPIAASRNAILTDLVKRADRTYRQIKTPNKKYGVRRVFTSMLAYAEANTNLTRIAEFMLKAEAMQERNPKLRRYGNFYWYSTESKVNDLNAVDFCMQHAMLLWRFHHDKLDADLQKRLFQILTLGVHEYVSSTYYGINLEALTLLKDLSGNAEIKETAGIILNLFWHDIALNWNNNTEILSGTGSRTYDFLYNRGELDQMMIANGWLQRPEGKNRKYFQYRIFTPLYTRWHPPASLYQLMTDHFPRNVEQVFGDNPRTARIHYLHRNITLSTSSGIYGGRMDVPLSIDFPETRSAFKPRLYFIPDGRNDPYGKKRITAGRTHSKSLHINPWWAAAQHKDDALAVVLYTDNVFKEITEGLQSHLVFRKQLDGLFVDNRMINIAELKTHPYTVNTNQCVFLREGDTVAAIQIPWAQGQGGSAASISIIDDGNKYGALRLSVSHSLQSPKKESGLETAGAAIRVRIASSIKTDQQFADFRNDFSSIPIRVEKQDGALKIETQGREQALIVEANSIVNPAGARIIPMPPTAVLALDGEDIGRAILEESSVVQEYIKNKTTMIPVTIAADTTTTWSVLKAAFTTPIERAADGHKEYLWSPEIDGARHGNSGKTTWQLEIAKAGKYAIEAEILAPTPEDDSFFVSATGTNDTTILPEFAWSTGTGDGWRWSRVTSRENKNPQQIFELPAGDIKLIFRTREAGIKISQLRLIPQ